MIERIMNTAILPAMTLLPERMASKEAFRMLLAIGMQESRFKHRRQIQGPARGYWQFESAGVYGVLTHSSSRSTILDVCRELNYANSQGLVASSSDLHAALEHNDVLAAVFARLLLWTDPEPLPVTAQGGWQLYLRTWRPGKPHPETWAGFYEASDPGETYEGNIHV